MQMQQQPPMQMAPGQQVMMQQQPGGPQYVVQQVFSMQDTLEALAGVYIKQKFDFAEMVTGCEMPNEYYVYSINQRNPELKKKPKDAKKIFKYKEKSTCYERQCMRGECKPFNMKIISMLPGPSDDKQVMRTEKECKCTYYCCNRPEMKCYYNEVDKTGGADHYLGKVYDPWDMCNYQYDIRTGETDTADQQVEYIIHASCCQLYFCCKCPCESCQKVVFEIHEGQSTGTKVGSIIKMGRDPCSNIAKGGDADEFAVDFP